MFCSKCGKEIQDNASFCPTCGNKVGESRLPVLPSKNRRGEIFDRIEFRKGPDGGFFGLRSLRQGGLS